MRKPMIWEWLKDVEETLSLDEILREVEESEKVEENPIRFNSFQDAMMMLRCEA